jgi:hypothetical protein
MRIDEIKVLKGPNYWSVRRGKLIQMKIDLEEMEQKPTNHILGFLVQCGQSWWLFPAGGRRHLDGARD